MILLLIPATQFAEHAQLLPAPATMHQPATAPQTTGAQTPAPLTVPATPASAQLPPKTLTAPPSPNPAMEPPFSALIKLALPVKTPTADPCSAMPPPACALHAPPMLSAKLPPLEVMTTNTVTRPQVAASLQLAPQLPLTPLSLTLATWSLRPAKTVLAPRPLDALLMSTTAQLALFATPLPTPLPAPNAQEALMLTLESLIQTAPLANTALSTKHPHRPLVTCAQPLSVLTTVPPLLKVKLHAPCGKHATQPTLVSALILPALMMQVAPLKFAQMDLAPHAMKNQAQEMNALLPLIPMNHGTHATPPLESAKCKLMKASPEVVSPESSLVPSCSSEPLSVSPSTAARRTANLTMPCKRPSSE